MNTILDPVNIFLKSLGYFQNLSKLDSDFRVIYFSKIESNEKTIAGKYLVCFYTKISGYIKYLGIEFLVFP